MPSRSAVPDASLTVRRFGAAPDAEGLAAGASEEEARVWAPSVLVGKGASKRHSQSGLSVMVRVVGLVVWAV